MLSDNCRTFLTKNGQNLREWSPLNHTKLLNMKWSKIVAKLERHTTEALNGEKVLGQKYTDPFELKYGPGSSSR